MRGDSFEIFLQARNYDNRRNYKLLDATNFDIYEIKGSKSVYRKNIWLNKYMKGILLTEKDLTCSDC